jgi:hypothetical protein
MRRSLTVRLLHAADDLQLLRADLNRLTVALLIDGDGVSEEAYRLLRSVFDRVGGMPFLSADSKDGRFRIPQEV